MRARDRNSNDSIPRGGAGGARPWRGSYRARPARQELANCCSITRRLDKLGDADIAGSCAIIDDPVARPPFQLVVLPPAAPGRGGNYLRSRGSSGHSFWGCRKGRSPLGRCSSRALGACEASARLPPAGGHVDSRACLHAARRATTSSLEAAPSFAVRPRSCACRSASRSRRALPSAGRGAMRLPPIQAHPSALPIRSKPRSGSAGTMESPRGKMGPARVECGRVSLRSTQRRPGMTHFSRDERSADASAP